MQAYMGEITPYYINGDIKNICLRVYFAGCDFKCGYCNVSDLLTFDEKFLVDLKMIKKEIRLNHSFLSMILFTGGEPCLQQQALIQLAQFARLLGLRIGVDTNGSKPDVLKILLENNLVDVIYLDVKTPFAAEVFEKVTKSKTFFVSSSELLMKIKASLTLLEKFKEQCEVVIVTPIIPNLVYRKEDLFSIAREIQHVASRWILRRFVRKEQVVGEGFKTINEPSFDFMETLREEVMKKFPGMIVEVG